jgi:stress response protein YsnF
MAKTVVGLFDNMTEAQGAVEDLTAAGLSRSDISIIAGNEQGKYQEYVGGEPHERKGNAAGKGAGIGAVVGGGFGLAAGLASLAIPGFGAVIAAGPIASLLTGAGIGAVAGGIIGGLTSAGVSKEDAEYFAEGVRRGGILVTVKADDDMADAAASVMDNHNAQDVQKKAAEWRAAGWQPGVTTAESASTRQSTPRKAEVTQKTGMRAEQTVPVVEEQVHVGKRPVLKGGVRIYTHTTEQPVEETVTLRDENVKVDRKRVDRPVTAADRDAFKESAIELTETTEQPVVSKTTRVVEEVSATKEISQREQKVRDTVRKQDVEVTPVGSTNVQDNDYRRDFETRYVGQGYRYADYEPAYQYGSTCATDDRYRNRDWQAIEPDVRRDWETRGVGPWEKFKDSIRYGWDRVRARKAA